MQSRLRSTGLGFLLTGLRSAQTPELAVLGRVRGALGSAVHMCLALSDLCPVLSFRGGCFEWEKLPGSFGVQERAFRLSSSPRGAHIPGFQPFYPLRICHSTGWPKWCWQIHSDFPPAEIVWPCFWWVVQRVVGQGPLLSPSTPEPWERVWVCRGHALCEFWVPEGLFPGRKSLRQRCHFSGCELTQKACRACCVLCVHLLVSCAVSSAPGVGIRKVSLWGADGSVWRMCCLRRPSLCKLRPGLLEAHHPSCPGPACRQGTWL